MLAGAEPRSFIGWAAVSGYLARALNMLGRHDEARSACEATLAHLGPEDRPFVALFLNLEVELAVAEAGIGDFDAARRRLDDLLVYHGSSDNPLTRGRLHEAYARAAASAKEWNTYRHHLAETRSWYRGTGTPALIARVAMIEALEPRTSAPPRKSDAPHHTTLSATRTRSMDARSSERRRDHSTEETMDAATVVLTDVTAGQPTAARELRARRLSQPPDD
jgi:tetratricopeptide (TPR) repeat protein